MGGPEMTEHVPTPGPLRAWCRESSPLSSPSWSSYYYPSESCSRSKELKLADPKDIEGTRGGTPFRVFGVFRGCIQFGCDCAASFAAFVVELEWAFRLDALRQSVSP